MNDLDEHQITFAVYRRQVLIQLPLGGHSLHLGMNASEARRLGLRLLELAREAELCHCRETHYTEANHG